MENRRAAARLLGTADLLDCSSSLWESSPVRIALSFLCEAFLQSSSVMSAKIRSEVDDSWRSPHHALTFDDIRQHLNWYYRIIDPDIRARYYQYQEEYRTSHFMILLAIIYAFILAPLTIITSIDEIKAMNNIADIVTSVVLLICICIGLSASCCFICSTGCLKLAGVTLSLPVKSMPLSLSPSMVSPDCSSSFCSTSISTLRVVIFSCTILFFTIVFCKRNLLQQCETEEENSLERFWMYYNCLSGISQAQMMTYQACGLFMAIIVLAVNLPAIQIEYVFFVIFVCFTVLVGTVCTLDRPQAAVTGVLFWFLCTMGTVVNVHTRTMVQFFLTEKEKQQTENFTRELKHTIANVAHDLKTPLSSFTNGMDLMEMLWHDMQACLPVANSVITGEDMQKMLHLTKQISDCLKHIRCTNSFMTMAINRCLDSTKASNSLKLQPKNESVELLEAVSLPLSIMQTVQNKIGVRLEVDGSIDSHVATHVITDKQWLQENILCLLSNAVKYSSRGGVLLRMLYKGKSEFNLEDSGDLCEDGDFSDIEDHASVSSVDFGTQGYLIFQVEDEGIGVPPAMQRSLFQPFQQTQRLAGGTGLGLYSLAKRIEAIKGRYGMRGRRDGNQGSLFWFSIPYRPDFVLSEEQLIKHSRSLQKLEALKFIRPGFDESARSNLLDSARSQSEPSSREIVTTDRILETKGMESRPLEVLIVDDAPTIIKITSIMLRRTGCRVSTAENGQDAIDALVQRHIQLQERSELLQKLRSNGDQEQTGFAHVHNPLFYYDIVLMDLQMPVMDGLESTKRIRQLEQTSLRGSPLRKVMIVGVSANSDEDTIAAAFAAGVDRFMPKPFTLDAFLRLIKDCFPRIGMVDHT
eukprot:scaffold3171_cov178-Ochromonas_danica.AAC.5